MELMIFLKEEEQEGGDLAMVIFMGGLKLEKVGVIQMAVLNVHGKDGAIRVVGEKVGKESAAQ